MKLESRVIRRMLFNLFEVVLFLGIFITVIVLMIYVGNLVLIVVGVPCVDLFLFRCSSDRYDSAFVAGMFTVGTIAGSTLWVLRWYEIASRDIRKEDREQENAKANPS